ncbi:MAG: response regulator transcription factor [Bacteroidetes bacterium]|nr:response regulator transcription factor [Bacteroidota bacterium]
MKKPKLSPREKEVLQLIMMEFSSSEIARTLNRSVRTIETIRKNIMVKTRTANLVALVKYALKNKLS